MNEDGGSLARSDTRRDISRAAHDVANEGDKDVIVFNGPVLRPHDDQLIDLCDGFELRRKNAMLVLTTFGGTADVAYRIARALQDMYEKFEVFVPGYCKSAGTLIATGASQLVLARHSELGPLDVQVLEDRHEGTRRSGLTPENGLDVLDHRTKVFFAMLFQEYCKHMNRDQASSAAADIVAKLYSGMYARVDPLRMSEMDRANRIAFEYGKRLAERGKNITENSLLSLIQSYPSHEFVIDALEAKTLFNDVRLPTPKEKTLARLLEAILRAPVSDTDAYVAILNIPRPDDAQEHHPAVAGSTSGTGGPDGTPSAGAAGDELAPPTGASPAARATGSTAGANHEHPDAVIAASRV